MPTFFDNCRCRDHVHLFGPTAFFDLGTTGSQAEMAAGLKPGAKCVVAAYDEDGWVIFSWYTLSRETVMPDPSDPGTKARVFFGELTKTKRLAKATAAKTEQISVFFNVLGNFKRPSVIKPKARRRR